MGTKLSAVSGPIPSTCLKRDRFRDSALWRSSEAFGCVRDALCSCDLSVRFLMPFKVSPNISELRSKTNGNMNRRYSLHTDGMSLLTIRPSCGWERTPLQPQRAIRPPTLPRRHDVTRRQDRHLPHPAGAVQLRPWRRVRQAGACKREGKTRDLEEATTRGVELL